MRQYTVKLTSTEQETFLQSCNQFNSIKNYFYQKYGSINGLNHLDSFTKDIRDVYTKDKFYNEIWGEIPSRFFRDALEIVVSNLKSNWKQTIKNSRNYFKLLKKDKKISDNEQHYINYIFKSFELLHYVLTEQNHLINIEKFNDINKIKINKLISRIIRKFKFTIPVSNSKSIYIDDESYSYIKNSISIFTNKLRKKLNINVIGNQRFSGYIVVKLENNRLVINRCIDVEKQVEICNVQNIVSIDKNYINLLDTNKETSYGKNFNKLAIVFSDKISEKNKERNIFYSLIKKYTEDIKTSTDSTKNKELQNKINNINKFNLGKIKYNNKFKTYKETLDKEINHSIYDLIVAEKPTEIIEENLNFTGKKKYSKRSNRLLSSWIKGRLKDRLEYICTKNNITLTVVNPAYTSQTCSRCGHFGERKGDMFYCPFCGEVVSSGFNAAKNVFNRKFDEDINLFTPFTAVKQILQKRLLESEEKLKKLSQKTEPTKTLEIKSESSNKIKQYCMDCSTSCNFG